MPTMQLDRLRVVDDPDAIAASERGRRLHAALKLKLSIMSENHLDRRVSKYGVTGWRVLVLGVGIGALKTVSVLGEPIGHAVEVSQGQSVRCHFFSKFMCRPCEIGCCRDQTHGCSFGFGHTIESAHDLHRDRALDVVPLALDNVEKVSKTFVRHRVNVLAAVF